MCTNGYCTQQKARILNDVVFVPYKGRFENVRKTVFCVSTTHVCVIDRLILVTQKNI